MKLDNKKERSCIVFLKIQFPLPAETFRSQQMFTSVWLQDFYFIIKYLDMVHLVQYFLTETVCLGWFESTKRVILVSVSLDLLPTIKSSSEFPLQLSHQNKDVITKSELFVNPGYCSLFSATHEV